jgi:hypothetical protein
MIRFIKIPPNFSGLYLIILNSMRRKVKKNTSGEAKKGAKIHV